MRTLRHGLGALGLGLLLAGCPADPNAGKAGGSGTGTAAPAGGADRKALHARAKNMFAPLPADMADAKHPITDERVALGKALYFDTRLSKANDIACNTCHDLAAFGVDNKPVSPGHEGQLGERNSPTVYNAALRSKQFWDGRAADVEEQATMPITNPVEMAMADDAAVVEKLKGIPGYAPLFKAAFEDEADPITMHNVGVAIGAFERTLTTPSRWDEFLGGKLDALSDQEVKGLSTFIEVNCQMCHLGPLLGGQIPQKLGLVKPWESKDTGIHKVTGSDADKHMFFVPGLRNVEKTAPYLHDGSIATLEEVTKMMAEYQLGKTLTDEQTADLVAFMKALTGKLPEDKIGKPKPPLALGWGSGRVSDGRSRVALRLGAG